MFPRASKEKLHSLGLHRVNRKKGSGGPIKGLPVTGRAPSSHGSTSLDEKAFARTFGYRGLAHTHDTAIPLTHQPYNASTLDWVTFNSTAHSALMYSALECRLRGLKYTQHSVLSTSSVLACTQHSVHQIRLGARGLRTVQHGAE